MWRNKERWEWHLLHLLHRRIREKLGLHEPRVRSIWSFPRGKPLSLAIVLFVTILSKVEFPFVHGFKVAQNSVFILFVCEDFEHFLPSRFIVNHCSVSRLDHLTSFSVFESFKLRVRDVFHIQPFYFEVSLPLFGLVP